MEQEIATAIPEWFAYGSVAANIALAITAAWALLHAHRRWGTARIQTELTQLQTRAAEEQANAAHIQATAANVTTLLDLARDLGVDL